MYKYNFSFWCICILHTGYVPRYLPVTHTHLSYTYLTPHSSILLQLSFSNNDFIFIYLSQLANAIFSNLRLESNALRQACDSAQTLQAPHSLRGPFGGICASLPGVRLLIVYSAARRWSNALGRAKPVWAVDIEYPWCRKSGP